MQVTNLHLPLPVMDLGLVALRSLDICECMQLSILHIFDSFQSEKNNDYNLK